MNATSLTGTGKFRKVGSARFRKVPVQRKVSAWKALQGSRRFRRRARCRLQAQVPEGSGRFRALVLFKFDIAKAYAHDTAAYMFLLFGMPPKLILCTQFNNGNTSLWVPE